MKFRKNYIILVLLTLLPFLTARAEGFVTLDGILSSRKVYQVAQDADGFVWMYTQKGIDRFDGHTVKTYRIEDLPQSRDQILSSTKIECDNSGVLWVAVKNGRLYRYDKGSDSFRLEVDLSSNHPGIALFSICFPEQGTVALGTSEGVFFLTEGGDESRYASEKMVKSIAAKGAKAFWLGTDNGVFLLDNCKICEVADNVDVVSMLYEGGKLYVGTFSEGVKVVGDDGMLRNFGTVSIKAPVWAMLKDNDGHLVVGSDGEGLFYFDPETEKLLAQYLTDDQDRSSIPGNTVSDLCLDENGNLWVSTTTDWVCRQRKGAPLIEKLAHQPGNTNSLLSDHINVLFEDKSGNIWFGANEGVCSVDQSHRNWRHYPMPELGVVLALTQDARGDVWVGGYGFPLYKINPSTRETAVFQDNRFDHVYSLLSDGDCVWIGGIDSPLARYNVQNESLETYPVRNVGDIRKSSDGKLTLATSGGLCVLEPTTGSVEIIDSFESKTLAYPVRCLANQVYTVWLATDGDGLICYDRKTGTSRSFTKESGLTDDSITGVVVDVQDNVWFTTFDSLYRLDPVSGTPVDMNGFLGITRGSFNPNAISRLSNGHLAFGTADGAIMFDPAEFSMSDPGQIVPLISGFKLPDGSKPTGLDNIELLDRITLKAVQNSFCITYSALDFTSGYRTCFSSQLVGFDKCPRQSDVAGEIDYYNIPSGKYDYILKVIDKYSGNILGERHLSILIRKPLWLSWWALAIYVILLGTFASMTVAWYRKKSYNRIMTEKINTFVNFAHDLKTPITLIKTPLNDLESIEDLSDKVRNSVMMANRNSDRLLSMINNLLDIRKNDRDWSVLRLTECDSGDYLDSVLADFSYAARQKGLDFSYYIEPGLSDIWIDREKMDLAIHNILSNAVKYTSDGFIKVLAKSERRSWTLEISDSGIGIPADFQSRIFRGSYRADNARECDENGYGIGLMITRQLVNQHHGTISYSSVEGQGTTFTLSFPKKYKASDTVIFLKTSDTVDPIQTPIPQDSDNSGNRILIVEDDAETLEYMKSALSEEYSITTAMDGRTALGLIAEKNPDIVISDVIMSLMNGYELCRSVKSDIATSHIPVILLTGMTDKESVIRGLESGADDYIVKPFDTSVLKARIRNILNERQRLREAIQYSDNATAQNEYSNKLDKEFMDKVISVVQKELSNSEFQINDLCRELAMSRTAFYNKLKSLTGQGPNDFIRIYRMEKSKEYLAGHRYSIAEVADMVGFSDAKYFSVCFKKQFGVSPSRF